jgi:hypothetical protein
MLLEAGGYIAEHIDSSVGMLENTNISLSNPDGCVWKWGDGSVLDMPPGSTSIVNIHYPHSIQNNSNEDRFHLIIHRHDCTDEWKELMRQGCEEQHVVGKYVNHEIAI